MKFRKGYNPDPVFAEQFTEEHRPNDVQSVKDNITGKSTGHYLVPCHTTFCGGLSYTNYTPIKQGDYILRGKYGTTKVVTQEELDKNYYQQLWYEEVEEKRGDKEER